MKGLQALFLGLFGIFAFSWLGMTVIPNLQIGSLDPQTDEDGTDVYPSPDSGMAARGAQVYAANGCVYCHSQQVRPDYGGSDLERKWGERRSAPRDYLFQPVVFLGKMRTGPDLANVGHRPALQEKGAAAPTGATAGTATAGSSPAAATAQSPAAASGPATGAAPATAAASPAGAAPSPGALPEAGTEPAANVATSAPSLVGDVNALTAEGRPIPYSAAWHHRHLYNPRSVNEDSNMPSYRFLYEKRRISGVASPDAVNFAGDAGDEAKSGWEIVPSYDAKCLVAYLMSRDQTHQLKEAKSPMIAAAPGTEAKK
jgi:cbb3-type cytochrome oxidase cytochrome c subunit